MSGSSGVLIVMSKDWLRERVRNAIRAWTEMEPDGPRRAKEYAKKQREALYRPNGMSASGDLSLSAVLPKKLIEILAMNEEDSEKIWGYKCGMGYHRVGIHEHDIRDAILQEMPDLKVSTLWGAPKARGWA